MVVDTWADLRIGLKAASATDATWGVRFQILAGTFLILVASAGAARSLAGRPETYGV